MVYPPNTKWATPYMWPSLPFIDQGGKHLTTWGLFLREPSHPLYAPSLHHANSLASLGFPLVAGNLHDTAPQALQLILPPLFPNYSLVRTARWVISQKHTLTLSGRGEFHILLLVLSTKTESIATWVHLMTHFSRCKHKYLPKRVE